MSDERPRYRVVETIYPGQAVKVDAVAGTVRPHRGEGDGEPDGTVDCWEVCEVGAVVPVEPFEDDDGK